MKNKAEVAGRIIEILKDEGYITILEGIEEIRVSIEKSQFSLSGEVNWDYRVMVIIEHDQ